jgi:peroxiredoxin
MRFLSVGREALDIEGVDQDGKQFKLSDYRGKVVLLYFWSEY